MAEAFTPSYMGIEHMIGKDTYEPQRTNNFEVVFSGLKNKVKSINGAFYGSPTTHLKLSTKSIGDLTTQISALQVAYGNNKLKFAGTPELQDISLSFYDYIGLETEEILMAWSYLVYNPITEKIGRASDYKMDGFLYEYDPSGENVRRWQLRGCWIGSITMGGFSQDNNSIREMSATLNVDKMIFLG